MGEIDEVLGVGRGSLDPVLCPGGLQFRDLAQCEKDARAAAQIGFDGKWAIHPDQVRVANEVFTPTADELAEAQALMNEYRQAEAGGVGAVGRDGKLVDAAMMRHAMNVLRRAGAIEQPAGGQG